MKCGSCILCLFAACALGCGADEPRDEARCDEVAYWMCHAPGQPPSLDAASLETTLCLERHQSWLEVHHEAKAGMARFAFEYGPEGLRQVVGDCRPDGVEPYRMAPQRDEAERVIGWTSGPVRMEYSWFGERLVGTFQRSTTFETSTCAWRGRCSRTPDEDGRLVHSEDVSDAGKVYNEMRWTYDEQGRPATFEYLGHSDWTEHQTFVEPATPAP